MVVEPLPGVVDGVWLLEEERALLVFLDGPVALVVSHARHQNRAAQLANVRLG